MTKIALAIEVSTASDNAASVSATCSNKNCAPPIEHAVFGGAVYGIGISEQVAGTARAKHN